MLLCDEEQLKQKDLVEYKVLDEVYAKLWTSEMNDQIWATVSKHFAYHGSFTDVCLTFRQLIIDSNTMTKNNDALLAQKLLHEHITKIANKMTDITKIKTVDIPTNVKEDVPERLHGIIQQYLFREQSLVTGILEKLEKIGKDFEQIIGRVDDIMGIDVNGDLSIAKKCMTNLYYDMVLDDWLKRTKKSTDPSPVTKDGISESFVSGLIWCLVFVRFLKKMKLLNSRMKPIEMVEYVQSYMKSALYVESLGKFDDSDNWRLYMPLFVRKNQYNQQMINTAVYCHHTNDIFLSVTQKVDFETFLGNDSSSVDSPQHQSLFPLEYVSEFTTFWKSYVAKKEEYEMKLKTRK